MRLMSVKASAVYIDQIDREPYGKKDKVPDNLLGKPNPQGRPVKGATKWFFRGLTSAEEGALTDSMFDLGSTKVSPSANEEDVKVDMAMSISPSTNRRHRVQLALTGWEGLCVFVHNDDPDTPDTQAVEYSTSTVQLGPQSFEGASDDVIDMLPQDVLRRMEAFVRTLSSVEAGEGKR